MSNTNGKPLLLACVLTLIAVAAHAHTMGDVEFTCPLTGTTFTATVDMSGTQFCVRLDGKPLGPTPAPWRVPECPDDGMVLFKDEFTTLDLDALRPFVQSSRYQKELRRESTHFRMAESLRVLGATFDDVGWAYLQASWQVETERPRYDRYLKLSRESFQRYLDSGQAAMHESSMSTLDARLYVAEIERRLGRFDEALTALIVATAEADGEPNALAWIEQIRGHVDERDAAAHVFLYKDNEQCAEMDREMRETARD